MVIFLQAKIVERVPDWDLIFKIIMAVIAITSWYIGYRLGWKAKKREINYQNKIAAFKEVNEILTAFKRYLSAVIAENQGNEFAVAPDEDTGALILREKLYATSEKNGIFLNQKSRELLNDFIGEISLLNNAELNIASGNNADIDWHASYDYFYEKTETIRQSLYNDLNS